MRSGIDAVRKEIRPLGATLEAGVVTAVDGTAKTVDVLIAGQEVADIPVAGGAMPVVTDKVWLIRQGTTVIALGKAA